MLAELADSLLLAAALAHDYMCWRNLLTLCCWQGQAIAACFSDLKSVRELFLSGNAWTKKVRRDMTTRWTIPAPAILHAREPFRYADQYPVASGDDEDIDTDYSLNDSD